MSRKHSRARKRRVRPEQLRAEVEAARAEGPEALWTFLRRLADTSQQAWDAARVAAAHHRFDDDETVMVQLAIDPRLAGSTRGMTERRETTVRKSRRSKRS